ncbi:hypothetical protein U1Q18_040568 [Sarracenia purpurea var. burkii]
MAAIEARILKIKGLSPGKIGEGSGNGDPLPKQATGSLLKLGEDTSVSEEEDADSAKDEKEGEGVSGKIGIQGIFDFPSLIPLTRVLPDPEGDLSAVRDDEDEDKEARQVAADAEQAGISLPLVSPQEMSRAYHAFDHANYGTEDGSEKLEDPVPEPLLEDEVICGANDFELNQIDVCHVLNELKWKPDPSEENKVKQIGSFVGGFSHAPQVFDKLTEGFSRPIEKGIGLKSMP